MLRTRKLFKELVDIIDPKVILCLGRFTFEGVLSAFDIKLSPSIKNYNAYIESMHNPVSVTLENGNTAYIFDLAHCGAITKTQIWKSSWQIGERLEDI